MDDKGGGAAAAISSRFGMASTVRQAEERYVHTFVLRKDLFVSIYLAMIRMRTRCAAVLTLSIFHTLPHFISLAHTLSFPNTIYH